MTVSLSRIVVVLTVVMALPCIRLAADDSNWPQWRGPLGNGHSVEEGFPTKWSTDSVAWKVDLKGEGQSSPTIYGDRIYLTTALERGAKRVVFCLDRNDGQLIWEKTAWTGTPNAAHKMNGWASASCTTDGTHVYAFFGTAGGVYCYTMDGEQVWSKQIGAFNNVWGEAACPLVVDDVVIQVCDSDDNAYITGLDKATGKEIWKTKRDNKRGWSSPILINDGGRRQVVVNGDTGVRSYDPLTGKEFWYCKSYNGRGTPTVTPGFDMLFTVNGKSGDVYAIKSDGMGNVTNTHQAWHTPRRVGRDLPSPILVGEHLMVASLRPGVLTSYNALDGKVEWQGRVNGMYSSTPVSFDGLAFFINEAGETLAVKPGPKMEIVSANSVGAGDDEIFRASLTPSGGQVFIRSNHRLYCIGKRQSK